MAGPGPSGASSRGKPLISVVVPCFNEEHVLDRTHPRLRDALSSVPDAEHEIVFVDDGSRDGTWQTLLTIADADPRVRLVRLTRNFGHQSGILAGLREARGDAVVVIDADLQDPPELIPEMVRLWADGWHVVTGRRLSRDGDTRFKAVTAFGYYRLLRAVADQPVAVDSGDFRLIDRAVVQALLDLPEQEFFLRGLVSWTGFPETSVGYVRAPRAAGQTKYSLRRMAELSRRGLVSCSSAPARVPTAVGAVWLTGAAVTTVVRRRVPPAAVWAFGCESMLLGMLAEYLRLVHAEVRGRPSYVVRERVGAPGTTVRPVGAEWRVS